MVILFVPLFQLLIIMLISRNMIGWRKRFSMSRDVRIIFLPPASSMRNNVDKNKILMIKLEL